MKTLRIKEILCVAVLLLFVLAMTGQKGRVSDASAADVGKAVSAAAGLAQLETRGGKAFQKEFGLDPQQFDGGYYAASDDVMEVRELLVVRLKDSAAATSLLEQLKQRVEQKIVLFEGYAAEQTALLKNYKLVQRGNFVLYTVCDAPSDAVRAFRAAL